MSNKRDWLWNEQPFHVLSEEDASSLGTRANQTRKKEKEKNDHNIVQKETTAHHPLTHIAYKMTKTSMPSTPWVSLGLAIESARHRLVIAC
jgi:hypothetical protein